MQPDTNSTINADGCMCGWGCVGGGGSLTSDEALLLGSRDQHQYYLFVLFCVFFFQTFRGPISFNFIKIEYSSHGTKGRCCFHFFFH